MRPAARERAFEQLVDYAGPKILAYLVRRSEPRSDAADVHQRVLLTTWRRFDELPANADDQVAWMIGVARRELANHRRAESRRSAAVERLVDLVERLRPINESTNPVVEELLSGLDDVDREIVTLTYWDNLTSDQVATVVGLSSAAVRKRLQRCRASMRASMSTSTTVLRGL